MEESLTRNTETRAKIQYKQKQQQQRAHEIDAFLWHLSTISPEY